VILTDQSARTTHAWLMLALFRAGLNTDAARFANELGDESPWSCVDLVARRLYPDSADRRRETDRAAEAADRAIRESTRLGVQIVPRSDPRFPPQLLEIVDPPPVLWVRGDPGWLSRPAVGVVGSRDAVPASLAVARRLGRELTEAGLVVVSGFARGVDGAAHLGALDGTGRTVGVLGSGLDVVYPSQHRLLAEHVSQTGAVVSELPPWAGPLPRHFPLRNRIISGLSKAIVIVEASERSGSLITARLALEQGRDVLAVPGGILSGRHRGSHALIKDGARLVETVEDVLDEIRWSRPAGSEAGGESSPGPMTALEATMAPGETYSVDDLAGLTGQSASEMLVELSSLELARRVTRLAGGQFMRMARESAERG
jgi:DNA processing protein